MSDMTPITPLGSQSPCVDTVGPVTMTEVTDTALASFASRLGQEDAAQAVLADLLGAEPPEPGRATEGTMGAFWMGPDQWMVTAPYESYEDLAAVLTNKAGKTASITEQTDGWCRFDLHGERLIDVLELLCPANLRGDTVGTATRTTIHHLGCFVLVRSTVDFTVFGPRSSAGSLHHALLTAMRAAH